MQLVMAQHQRTKILLVADVSAPVGEGTASPPASRVCQRLGLYAIAVMAAFGFESAEQLVAVEGLLGTAVTAMRENLNNWEVQQSGCRAIANLVLHSAKAREVAGATAGLLDAMVAGMQAHEWNGHNQRIGLDAIANLCYTSTGNAARLATAKGIFPTIAAAVKLRPTDAQLRADLQHSAKRAITNMVLQNETCAAALVGDDGLLQEFKIAAALSPPEPSFSSTDIGRAAKARVMARMAAHGDAQ